MQVGGSLHFGISNKRPSPQDPDSSVAERRVFEEIVETDEVSRIDEMAASDSELSQGGGKSQLDLQSRVFFKNKNINELPVFSQKAIRAYESIALSKPSGQVEVVGVDLFV